MRKSCPVAYSEFLQWSVFKHEDVIKIINDPEKFSNAVSQHLSVPNGMDPPEHTVYRRIIDKYFTPERMTEFEPKCREIVSELVNKALELKELDIMADFALPFSVRIQCAFLGWPPEFQKPLADWTNRNYQATLALDRKALSEIAREFEAMVDSMRDARLDAYSNPQQDVTSSLMYEKVWGRELSNEELSSILRNWTVGEIGSIASSIGILIHFLAEHDEAQAKLRADYSLITDAADEILRIHGPLVNSRRIAVCPVEVGGKKIEAGERISLNWISVNRDEEAFEAPEEFRLGRDQAKNLLYGTGIHVCPGAPLARMEMRVVLEELFNSTTVIKLAVDRKAVKARYPASGYSKLPVILK